MIDQPPPAPESVVIPPYPEWWVLYRRRTRGDRAKWAMKSFASEHQARINKHDPPGYVVRVLPNAPKE